MNENFCIFTSVESLNCTIFDKIYKFSAGAVTNIYHGAASSFQYYFIHHINLFLKIDKFPNSIESSMTISMHCSIFFNIQKQFNFFFKLTHIFCCISNIWVSYEHKNELIVWIYLKDFYTHFCLHLGLHIIYILVINICINIFFQFSMFESNSYKWEWINGAETVSFGALSGFLNFTARWKIDWYLHSALCRLSFHLIRFKNILDIKFYWNNYYLVVNQQKLIFFSFFCFAKGHSVVGIVLIEMCKTCMASSL